jgi:hypothetical protein
MEKLYEYKTIKSKGAKIYLIRMQGDEHWKMHRWDGPAIQPMNRDSEFTKSYYLHGIPYSEENYNELMQQREGLPWYKNPSMKNLLTDYRN